MENLSSVNVNTSKCVFVGKAVYNVNANRKYSDSSKEKVRAVKARKEQRVVSKHIKKVKPMALDMSVLVAICRSKILHLKRKLLAKANVDNMEKFMQKFISEMHKNNIQQ